MFDGAIGRRLKRLTLIRPQCHDLARERPVAHKFAVEQHSLIGIAYPRSTQRTASNDERVIFSRHRTGTQFSIMTEPTLGVPL